MDNILLILIITFFVIILQKNIVETFIEDREDGHTYIAPSVKDKNVNISGNVNVNNDLKVIGKLINKHNQDLIPKGMIVMWGGNVNNIPTGWHLCDGSNGTPDLRGRFISSYVPNNKDWTVGPKNTNFNGLVKLNINLLPPHNHSGKTGNVNINHTHHGTTNSMNRNAVHNHGITVNYHGRPDGWGDRGHPHYWHLPKGPYPWNDSNPVTKSTNTNHEHTFTTAGVNNNAVHNHTIPSQGLGQTFDARPYFYALAFIMKL